MSGQYIYAFPSAKAPSYFLAGNWIYEMNGQPAYYVAGGFAYTPGGQPAFSVKDKYLYAVDGIGDPKFYLG
jgi:hypothetical protein